MYELIYTSVPKGLIPGRSGFTTVGMSEGMPPNLIVPLENLSGYNFTLRDNTFLPILNPPCCYYIKMRYGNQQLHVAGRVAPNGLDYSQRNNKIAHHLLFESAGELENLSGGVAGLFLKDGVFRSDYTEEPATLPFRKVPICTQVGFLPARTWAELAGHAGFAAYTAERFRENPDKPLYLIYPAGTPADTLLNLVMEVCALLGEKLRNYLTFSTYFGSSTASVDCFLRMVPEFSPLVPNLRRFHKNDVIELGQENELPLTENYSDIYEYACTGIRPQFRTKNETQSLTQHTIKILADSGLPPEPVKELLNDTPVFTVPPPEPPVSYRKFVFTGVAAVIAAAIASLLLYDMPGKTQKPEASGKENRVQIYQKTEVQPAGTPVPTNTVKSILPAVTSVPEEKQADPDRSEVQKQTENGNKIHNTAAAPQAPGVRQDIFTTPALRKNAAALPQHTALQLFIKLNSIKDKSAAIKFELPNELRNTLMIYPVMERIGTSTINNRLFVEKGKVAGEVFIRAAQSGSLPPKPVKGEITDVPHLRLKLSNDKKFLQITSYADNLSNCIMPEISKLKQLFFQLPDKVYIWENKFPKSYIKQIKPGKLVISGNDLPQYTPLEMEKVLKPFVSKKFGKCSEATFLSSSFYLADWNKTVGIYLDTLKIYEQLQKKLHHSGAPPGEPRDLKAITDSMKDLKKRAAESDIKLIDSKFKDFLNKFFNPDEKILVTAHELENLSEKLASIMIDLQLDQKKHKIIIRHRKEWNTIIKKIEAFQLLRKSVEDARKKLTACQQKLNDTANRMMTAAKNIHPDIEKILPMLMKDANAPSWQIKPDYITTAETARLCNEILKKITYEPITSGSDGE